MSALLARVHLVCGETSDCCWENQPVQYSVCVLMMMGVMAWLLHVRATSCKEQVIVAKYFRRGFLMSSSSHLKELRFSLPEYYQKLLLLLLLLLLLYLDKRYDFQNRLIWAASAPKVLYLILCTITLWSKAET